MSPSSNEEATTPEISLQYAISIPSTATTTTILSDLFKNNQLNAGVSNDATSSAIAAAAATTAVNHALNRHICNDLRVSANKSFSQNVRAARPYLSPRHIDGTATPATKSFENRLNVNRLSEKRQSDPQIRYAFYNRGFEMTTSTKHRKYSLSQYEVRRKAMPDIDEYEACENDVNNDDDDDDESNGDDDEWQQQFGLRQNLQQYYTGSSGRDITLLPKLKIRICDEMGARIHHSTFDESASASPSSSSTSSFSFDGNFSATAAAAATTTVCDDLRTNLTSAMPKFARESTERWSKLRRNTFKVDRNSSSEKVIGRAATAAAATASTANWTNENDIPICKKCGHKLEIQKQFTDAFT